MIAPNTVKSMAGEFIGALQLSVDRDREAREWVSYQLAQAADPLPEPDAWTVIGQRESARVIFLAGDTLFTVVREAPPEEDAHIVIASHPAEVTGVKQWRSGQRTSWRFEFRHGPAVSIEGKFDHTARPDDPETFDQAETFARELACHAGWRPAQSDPPLS